MLNLPVFNPYHYQQHHSSSLKSTASAVAVDTMPYVSSTSPLNSSSSSSHNSSASEKLTNSSGNTSSSNQTAPLSIASMLVSTPPTSFTEEETPNNNDNNQSTVDHDLIKAGEEENYSTQQQQQQQQQHHLQQQNTDNSSSNLSSISATSSPTYNHHSPVKSAAATFNPYLYTAAAAAAAAASQIHQPNLDMQINQPLHGHHIPNYHQNYHQYLANAYHYYPSAGIVSTPNHLEYSASRYSNSSGSSSSNSSYSSIKQESEENTKPSPPPISPALAAPSFQQQSAQPSHHHSDVFYNNMNLIHANPASASCYHHSNMSQAALTANSGQYFQRNDHEQSQAYKKPTNPIMNSNPVQPAAPFHHHQNHHHRSASRQSNEYTQTSGYKVVPNDPSIKVKLQDLALWKQFSQLGTEMIITKCGRRMFPHIRVNLSGLSSHTKYKLAIDIVPFDDNRYKYHNGEWVVSGKGETSFPSVDGNPRGYIHPDCADGSLTGNQWMKQIVSFHKLKLTNNPFDKAGHIVLNSMQKYMPRFHLFDENKKTVNVFTFAETEFMAVTAYQNEAITKLKIEHNPFAKGFRDGQNRK